MQNLRANFFLLNIPIYLPNDCVFRGNCTSINCMFWAFGATADESLQTDPNEIAIYAGLVTSVFAFSEFTTGVMWGRISDKYGRKPVLIMGLIGTMLSMLIFGFAKSLPVALLARAVGGALNGNIGVIQTTVAELVTEKEHQPRAYAVMPLVWCIGYGLSFFLSYTFDRTGTKIYIALLRDQFLVVF